MNRYSKKEDSSPLPGAAYIRYSSEMQSDSFSLDARLRQIKEQAERDSVEIVKVFSDPAQSAYRKKFRPGINAMREAARRGEFKVLYVHKVDRLARRLEWSLEIVHELQSLDIVFKAVQQPFDLGTPEGKLLFHLVSSLGEFYSDNLSKETNKGKLERSLQGFHNGAVPWGYVSTLQGNRKVGVPDPVKAPIVLEMFERYATGIYSDMQLTEWMNSQGLQTNRGHPFGKDTVRDMLCNAYYTGQIRYRGMSARPKGVSFRSTPPKVADGQHVAIISAELWQQCQTVRANRRVKVDTLQKTVRINLLQGLVVCARCGRRLRIQTPTSGPTYYQEDSHLRGYRDCADISQCVRAESIDAQVGGLIQSLKLPADWEDSVRRLCQQQRDGPDPETERKDIRTTLRLMRGNYEHGLYEDEEYQYWQKVSALKEKLELLNRIPEPAIEKAARTLLDLRASWEWATKEERKELARMMIQEVGVDVVAKRVIWIKACLDFDMLFELVNNLRVDEKRRFWIEYHEPKDNVCDIGEGKGQEGVEVKTSIPVSHNALTRVEENVQ
jgi:site-specific DNA recombinase